jgi:hypothetical protein
LARLRTNVITKEDHHHKGQTPMTNLTPAQITEVTTARVQDLYFYAVDNGMEVEAGQCLGDYGFEDDLIALESLLVNSPLTKR